MASDPDLRVSLESSIPARIPTGRATAVFCYGSCSHRRGSIERLELLVDGAAQPAAASEMRRPDSPDEHGGFWGTASVPPRDRAGAVEIRVRAWLGGQSTASQTLAAIEVVEPEALLFDPPAPIPVGAPPIAICMATFDPDPELFRRQLASLRSQSEQDWVCLISDDCSRPERFEVIEAEIGDDPRFVLSRSEQRLGFYRNFERALVMVPAETELVALCDQDDYWYPEKLATLKHALGNAQLAYCDARLVDADGGILAETMWEGRQNNDDSLASMMITNTITGAASLFRRRIIDLALPFPEGPGWQFHDHWLGMVALASGGLTYVDRPLYDYVQHGGAVLRGLVGETDEEGPRRVGWPAPSRARLRAAVVHWKARYFYGYVPLRLRAEILLARCSSELSPAKRRALRRLIAAEDSIWALGLLMLRRLRRLFGRGETLGTEALLATGLLWRRMIALCARSRRGQGRATCDASMPSFEPESLEPRRWRRRQTRRARRLAEMRRSTEAAGNR